MQKGFTITELLVTVFILSVLAAIGIPMYNGYQDASDVTLAQNNLRAIHLQQQEYFINNNAYYSTGASCTDSNSSLNTDLFGGTQVLTTDAGFYYCVLQTSSSDFTAHAQEIDGARDFTINQLNVTNF